MKRRIRVTQLVTGLAIGEVNGGGELFAVRLAQFLDPAQFEVSVLAMWAYDSPIERAWQRQLAAQGIATHFATHYRAQFRTDFVMAYLCAYPLLWRLRPDILNTHTEYADMVGAALKATGAARRMVRTGHNVVEWPFDLRIWRKLSRIYPWVADMEVGVSRAVVQMLGENPAARLRRRPARYIPNAIDPELVLAQRSGRDMRALLGIAPQAPLFGVVGRLSEQKGLPYLIRAMHLVRAALPEARLLIIGNGERRDELHALVTEQGLGDCITFLGPRSDAIDLIASLDAFVSSSLWEGLPTVILEAMLLGTPVVATNIAGSRDLVIDGATGLLVPPRDPAALAQAMLRMIREPANARAMAEHARSHIEQFAIRTVAHAYGQLYAELLGG